MVRSSKATSGLRFPCRLNRLLSIGSFRDNFHIGLGIDQHFQSGAENCVIIRNHDSDLVCVAPAFQVLLCPVMGWESWWASGTCTRILVPLR
jgi:hypothetical protein